MRPCNRMGSIFHHQGKAVIWHSTIAQIRSDVAEATLIALAENPPVTAAVSAGRPDGLSNRSVQLISSYPGRMKYLKYLPKPLLDDLGIMNVVPFVGAGFSKNATIPTGLTMPDWEQLGRALAEELAEFEYFGALDAISAYAHENGRTRLIERLRALLLIEKSQPGPTHRAFCRIPFDLVFTTNFDFLLERAYDAESRPCSPVTSEEQLALTVRGPAVRLVKIHGDLNHPDRLVAVERDYDGILQAQPLMATYLASSLVHRTAFFVGYSLDDPDFRQIWQILAERLGGLRRPAYTVSVNPTKQAAARYERRGIKLIHLPGKAKDYPQILEQLFSEIDEFVSREIARATTPLREDTQEELVLAPPGGGRLCLFMIPHTLQPVYRSVVFPIVEAMGLKPATPEEFISQGENIVAKIASLVDRSEIFVIDLSSAWAEFELGLIQSRAPNLRKVLIVAEVGAAPPIRSDKFRLIFRAPPEQMDLV